MLYKISTLLFILFAGVLFYFYNEYENSYTIKLIAAERISYIQQAADNFSNCGIFFCLISWILTNFIILQSSDKRWLLLPVLLVCIVSILVSSHAEEIFIFKKQEGLWDGSFSLSFLIAVFSIIGSFVLAGFNFIVLTYFLNKKPKI
jgi:predicted membrane protein